MRSAHLALKNRPTMGDKGLKTPSSADNRLIDTTQTAREESEIFIRKPEVRDQRKSASADRCFRPDGATMDMETPTTRTSNRSSQGYFRIDVYERPAQYTR